MEEMLLKPIAVVHNDYTEKFGIPRQAGLVQEMESRLVFEPPYRVAEALRGIEEFDYLWLIWQFSANVSAAEEWSPTVRPPRLGGNRRLGVFATRSPFRPNALGLSSVRLLKVDWQTSQGPVIHIAGADLMDGTPVYDIKPYIPYADAHPEAKGGFASEAPQPTLQVCCAEELLQPLEVPQRRNLLSLLALDPRPSYKTNSDKVYGFLFAGHEVRFSVQQDVLTVHEIV